MWLFLPGEFPIPLKRTILPFFARESQRESWVTLLRPAKPCFIIERFRIPSEAARAPNGAEIKQSRGSLGLGTDRRLRYPSTDIS
jgi:hypothetical protein